MIKYITQERKKYWPVSAELMAQYKDGSHTYALNGNFFWQNQNGLRHRDGDKPASIGAYGNLEWRQHDKLHRDGDLPAVIYTDGTLQWWKNGQLHRFVDPAVIYSHGELEWWVNDENITEEVNEWLNREEWQGTPEQIVELQLRFL